jgi:hypothetical protein
MIGWLQQLPPLPLAVVCSGAFVLLTWFGIVFVRPFLRLLLRRQPGANDLVSYTSSWFSLLYGLLLGLLAVATYQNAAQIQTSVLARQRRWRSSTGAARPTPSRCARNCNFCSATTRSTSSTRTGRPTMTGGSRRGVRHVWAPW